MFFSNFLTRAILKSKHTYMYGIQGGSLAASTTLYWRKLELLSMRTQNDSSVSRIFWFHSSLLTAAQSKAASNAKYELKLFILRKCFMTFMNLHMYRSRSLASLCSRMRVLALKIRIHELFFFIILIRCVTEHGFQSLPERHFIKLFGKYGEVRAFFLFQFHNPQ